MPSDFDASEFVDDDFQAARKNPGQALPTPVPVSAPQEPNRAPTREEVEARVNDMQHKLSELKRAQQDLERERAGLEETRRRQLEFTTGREEMAQHLTRGIALLEESEFAARREAEQMAKTLASLREALVKIEGIQQESWTKENLSTELTRASTLVENARMEYNSARLKFAVINGAQDAAAVESPAHQERLDNVIRQKTYADLCKMGLALTWPIALVTLAIFLVLLLR